MHSELTNLLPPERQRALARNYYLHLGVVAALFLTGLTLAAAALLVPTYVFLVKSGDAKETRLATIDSSLSSTNEKELSTRLAALEADATLLTALSTTPSASKIVSEVLTVSHPGVILSGFAYAPATAKKPGVLTVSGTATTRDALRNYQLALQGSPFAASAVLPVSAYAKDTDIGFTISVSLTP